ncbi:MAG: hypothetical protein Kow0027_00150 [Saprospiraceae bacterium]
MRFILLNLLLLLLPVLSKAQPGCTDPQANNYDPAATENDGSCLYDPTFYTPILLAQLPADIDEASGLAFFEGKLFTQEDGGNPEKLYELDTMSGELLGSITIPLADNVDWEDLAESPEYLFIGDFGNNAGNRTDLKIYRLSKAELLAGSAIPEVIEFSFSDQTDFTPAQNANNYDCEAFLWLHDSLHLFSKNWLDFKTRHYVLPATPGLHVAELRDSLNVQGQITGADVTEDGRIALLGYNVSTSEAFLWLLFDFDGNRLFSGNKRKISLGSALTMSQPEGIAFSHSGKGFIASENFSVLPPKLFKIDIDDWTLPVNVIEDPGPEMPFSMVLPNPFHERFAVYFPEGSKNVKKLVLTDVYGKVFYEEDIPTPQWEVMVDLTGNSLPAGACFLLLYDAEGRQLGAHKLIRG